MAINETVLTPETISMMQAQQSTDESKFAEGLAKSFDLPSTLADALEKDLKNEGKPKEEPANEEQTQEEPKAQEESESSEGAEENSEEELVPKSKVQKRIDELTREKARLESRLRRLEEGMVQAKPVDSETDRISKMSESELASLKREIRIAQLSSTQDQGKLAQLLDLEDKVETAIRTAPQRFQQTQVGNFQSSWSEIAGVEGDSFSKDFQSKLFQEANNIYARSNALKRDVNGQAEALWAAYDKLSAIRNLSDGKTKTNELERQVNTLKKKISVDSSSKKSSQEADSMQKLFHKARNGDTRSKEEFLRKRCNTDALVSEDDLGIIR